MHTRTPLIAAAVLAGGAALALAVPLAASAHVTVSPDSAEPGAYTTLTVNAPTESDTASTVKVVLDLPTDTPILSVRWVPVAGWTAETTTEKLPKPVTSGDDTITEAVTRVTWTATGGGTPPGATQQFPLSVGPVPDVGSLRFPAHQYYSDGTVVDWTEKGEDAEHPAPTLSVRDAAPAGEHSSGTHDETVSTPQPLVRSESGTDLTARGIGIGGLIVGAAGVVVAVLALRRRSA